MTYLKVKNGEFLGEMDSGKLDESDLLHPGKAKKAAVSGPESPVVGSDVNSAMSAIKSLVQSTSVGSIHRPVFEYLPSSGESNESVSAEAAPAVVKPSIVAEEPAPAPLQEPAVIDKPVAVEEPVVASEEPISAEEPVAEEPVADQPVSAEQPPVEEEINAAEETNESMDEHAQSEESTPTPTTPDVAISEELPASEEIIAIQEPEASEVEAQANLDVGKEDVAIADATEEEQVPEATEQSAPAAESQ